MNAFILATLLTLTLALGFVGPAQAHDETASPQNCAQVPVGYCYWCPETYSYSGHVHCTVKDWCVRVLVCVPGTFRVGFDDAPVAPHAAAGASSLP